MVSLIRKAAMVLMLSALCFSVLANEDAAQRGMEVVEKWDLSEQGYEDSKTDMKMVLESRNGETSERVVRLLNLEVDGEDDGDWSLIVFESPRDIKGTALLSYPHIMKADEQWIYLPSLNRVKRIASNNKSGPFAGSEFAYEDLVSQELPRYDYVWLREESCGDSTCDVVEQTPRYENSGYTKLEVWYERDESKRFQIDYFDRKGERLKTLSFKEYQKHIDQYWRAHRWEMENHQTGDKTFLLLEGIEFKTGLTERDFSRSRLERSR